MPTFQSKGQYLAINDIIKQYDTICVFRHVRPDGDAYGSQWGMVQFLKDTYPNKTVYGLGTNDGSLAHLFPEVDIIDDDIIKKSLVIVTDTSNRERIDDQRYLLGHQIIKIDHHPNVDPYGQINFVNDTKSSCCEIIAEMACYLNNEQPLSKACASYLYTGISTDTMSFSTSSVTWETLDIASYLLKSAQLDLALLNDSILSIDDNIYDYVTCIRQNAKSELKGKIIYTYIEPNVLQEYGITASVAKEYVNTFKTKKRALIWLLLVNEDGLYNVSMRSRQIVINDIAVKYGGGGHQYACATRNLTFADTKKLLEDLKTRINEHSIK